MDQIDNTFLTYTVMVHEWLNQPGYASLFLVSLLASTLVPMGSEWLLVMMLASGYPPLPAVVTAGAGNYLGAVTTWLVGIYGGRWLIEKVFRISAEQQERSRNYYKRYGTFTLFFSWVPIIGDPICLVGGLMRINFWTFSALVASGKLLRYAAIAWFTLHTTG